MVLPLRPIVNRPSGPRRHLQPAVVASRSVVGVGQVAWDALDHTASDQSPIKTRFWELCFLFGSGDLISIRHGGRLGQAGGSGQKWCFVASLEVVMTTSNSSVDLTPFGFTGTESAAYGALLEVGPSSGYRLARALGIARANTYQALRGLVRKGAASAEGQDPEIYRAIRPDALLAQIAKAEQTKLDVLERQMASQDQRGAEATAAFSGERELYAIALRTVTREPGPVACLAPVSVLAALVPIWRKRAADEAETSLWILGETSESLPIPVVAPIPTERAVRHFGSPVAILTTGPAVGLGRLPEGQLTGLWSSDPSIVGAVRAALEALTA